MRCPPVDGHADVSIMMDGLTSGFDRIVLERVTLRRARPDDLAAIHHMMSNAETMRFWSTPPHTTRKQTESWFEAMLAPDPLLGDEFIIEYEGQAIGKIGAWRLPEIGFFIDKAFWHRGLATEALLGFIAYMRSKNQPLLTADVDPLNTASLKLLDKAGFVITGTAHGTYIVGNRVCDSVYLALDLTTETTGN